MSQINTRQRHYLKTEKNRFIGLISSVPSEGRFLIKKLLHIKNRQLLLYEGKIYGKNIVYSISGIGKTNASHAATLLIEKYIPSLIINFGICGAYPSSGLKVGDIAVAVKEVYGDEGVILKDGFHGTDFIGIPLLRKGRKKHFNEFVLDKKLVKQSVNLSHICSTLARGWMGDFKIKSGAFVTVSTCTGTNKRALDLEKRFGAICENMEGAAVAHICCLYGIPFVEIRGISNIVENRDINKWDIRLASENCQKAVMGLLNIL